MFEQMIRTMGNILLLKHGNMIKPNTSAIITVHMLIAKNVTIAVIVVSCCTIELVSIIRPVSESLRFAVTRAPLLLFHNKSIIIQFIDLLFIGRH